MDNLKLYVIVRKDLQPGQIIAQSVHAAQAFTLHGDKNLVDVWDNGIVVILGAADEKELTSLMGEMEDVKMPYKKFIEPWWGNSVTGFSTIRKGKEKLFKGLQLLTF